MRINVISHFACSVCSGNFLLSIHKKKKGRIIDGRLECKKCGKFSCIKDGIACFVSSCRKPTGKSTLKLRKITLQQEIPRT